MGIGTRMGLIAFLMIVHIVVAISTGLYFVFCSQSSDTPFMHGLLNLSAMLFMAVGMLLLNTLKLYPPYHIYIHLLIRFIAGLIDDHNDDVDDDDSNMYISYGTNDTHTYRQNDTHHIPFDCVDVDVLVLLSDISRSSCVGRGHLSSCLSILYYVFGVFSAGLKIFQLIEILFKNVVLLLL